MKKAFLTPLLLLTIILLVSACSRGENSGTVTNPVGVKRDLRRPDFGQPDKEPDIRGLVKSITGNEVTILKVDLRGGFKQGTSTLDRAPSSSPSSPILSTGSGPRDGFGPGAGRNREGDSNRRAEMLARIKEMSTGEEKITIPVGIRMLKPEAASNNRDRNMVEASLSDISADKTITVWLNSAISDSKVAEFVLIN